MPFEELKNELLYILDKAYNPITRKLIVDILGSIQDRYMINTLRKHNFCLCYSEYGYYDKDMLQHFTNELKVLAVKVKDEDIRRIFLELYDMYSEK